MLTIARSMSQVARGKQKTFLFIFSGGGKDREHVPPYIGCHLLDVIW